MHFEDRSRLVRALMFFAAIVASCLAAPLAWAGGLPGGLDRIHGKAQEVEVLFHALAAVIVVIGAIWSGLKFVKGDQDAWSYVWKFGLGAILVASAPEIVMWIQG